MRRGIRLDDLQVALVILPPLEKGGQGGLGIRNPPKSPFKKGGLEPVGKAHDEGSSQKLSKDHLLKGLPFIFRQDSCFLH